MIIRVARARISAGKLDDFKDAIEREWIPWLRSQRGMLGFYPGIDPEGAEFVMVSLWEDAQCLEAIGGRYWTRAIAGAEQLPLMEEVHVGHYEAFGQA